MKLQYRTWSASAITIILLLQLTFVGAEGSGYLTSSEPIGLAEPMNGTNFEYDMISDSKGNLHLISNGVNNSLTYSMAEPDGTLLISNSEIEESTNNSTELVILVNSLDQVHIFWRDDVVKHNYHLSFDPYDSPMGGGMININNYIVLTFEDLGLSNSSKMDAVVDSNDDLHLIYLDGPKEIAEISYSMYRPDFDNGTLQTMIAPSIVTDGVGSRGNPTLLLDMDDDIVISWDDSRGAIIELVFIVDTSGSMHEEWADICTLLYGGNFQSGANYKGLKNIASENNVALFETIYGLGNTLPGAASQGNCAAHNKNSGPRSTALSSSDDSGGLRTLPGTVYNGATYSGYSGEDWGPGSNWACLSWKDAQGHVPGNPPTSSDHRWNASSTKFVLPLSDEGPKDGDPSQQADDTSSINEAHDNCLNAGVVPVGLYAQSYGGAVNIESHMRDLVQCPNGVVSSATRNCPGNSVRSTDAGGQAYEFPYNNQNATLAFAEAIEQAIYQNSHRNIFFKVLDPSAQISSPFFQLGDEVYNPSLSLILVDDTKLTNEIGKLTEPHIAIDSNGKMHIVWLESLLNTNGQSGPNEVMFSKIDYLNFKNTGGEVNGYKISHALISSTTAGWNEFSPSIVIDDSNYPQITWFSSNETLGLVFHRQGLVALLEYPAVSSLNIDNLVTTSDSSGGLFISWSDNTNCVDSNYSEQVTLCLIHYTDSDSDNDGYDNEDDKCPGFDDDIDVDADGIPDGCDDNIDSDGDGVSNSEDICDGYDDNIDLDNDSIPDGCDSIIDSDGDLVSDIDDLCQGHDDGQDLDSDGIPDGCDEIVDSDGDGVSNVEDICEGYDDNIDLDNDSIPDGCDNIIDSDGDLVPDVEDLCWGHDDNQDIDSDGTPDGCDDNIDSDEDGVSNLDDLCHGFDDTVDIDSDGVPDGCDSLIDSDSDNLSDSDDNCPTLYNPSQKDFDSDGLGNECDLDDDDDSIPDLSDLCPSGMMEWTSSNITDFDSDGCLDSLEDSDDDNDGVIDARDKCPGEFTNTNYVDSDSDGCQDLETENTGSTTFINRLKAGDLDAIGILLALSLPIIGIIYSSNSKSRRRNIMSRYESKILELQDDDKLDQIRKEVTSFASRDLIGQAQYQVLIDLINSEREKIAISGVRVDELFENDEQQYITGDIVTDEHGFEWKNDGESTYYRHELSFPDWKKY